MKEMNKRLVNLFVVLKLIEMLVNRAWLAIAP